MPLIAEAVRKILRKSAETGYDPAIGTNWCHLPMEMRAKCIKEMDFRTRIRLSSTSMTEKSVVENSEKYHFDVVRIFCDYLCLNIEAENRGPTKSESITTNFELPHEAEIQGALRSLKMCDIDTLDYNDCYSDSETVLTAFAECVPFRCRRLKTHCRDWETMKFFLDNSPNLKVITSDGLLTFQEAADHPMVSNVKELRIEFLENIPGAMVSASKLIRKWMIEMDAEVGKSLKFFKYKINVNRYFAEEFKERLIQRTDDVVRIRMNNETKQIIVRTIPTKHSICVYVSCKVVPIDLPESEYVLNSYRDWE